MPSLADHAVIPGSAAPSPELGAAWALLEAAVTREPASAEVHAARANVLVRRGKLDLARRSYELAARFDPYDAASRLALGELASMAGDARTAQTWFDRAFALRRLYSPAARPGARAALALALAGPWHRNVPLDFVVDPARWTLHRYYVAPDGIEPELPDCDLVLSPVSGGGLLSGIATAIKLTRPATRVVGVEPELAADAQESFRSGTLVSWPAEKTTRTLCDGLRTQSLGERNFAHIRAYVDDIITVTEAEIRSAMRTLLHSARLTPEPSGACSAAAILFHRDQLLPFRKAVVVMSGGNVEPQVLQSVLAEKDPQ